MFFPYAVSFSGKLPQPSRPFPPHRLTRSSQIMDTALHFRTHIPPSALVRQSLSVFGPPRRLIHPGPEFLSQFIFPESAPPTAAACHGQRMSRCRSPSVRSDQSPATVTPEIRCLPCISRDSTVKPERYFEIIQALNNISLQSSRFVLHFHHHFNMRPLRRHAARHDQTDVSRSQDHDFSAGNQPVPVHKPLCRTRCIDAGGPVSGDAKRSARTFLHPIARITARPVIR